MKKYVFLGISLFLTALGGAYFYFNIGEPITKSKSHEETTNTNENLSKKQSNDISAQENANEAISITHDFLNDLLGWGGAKTFDFKDNKENIGKLHTYIKEAISLASNETIKSDLNNALKAVEKAEKNKDVYGLLVAHRIFHDLDGYLNNDPLDGNVWGYTQTASGSSKKAEKYLK
ncbi:hypothetical protein QT238_13095 [Geobacillus stearothermophilus]|nr:hypothetical protein QT238_13095 [Geobacillus stearothermophilus]